MRGVLVSAKEIIRTLADENARQDEQGRYQVRGQLISFMGAGDEFIVDETVVYFVGEEERKLIDRLVARGHRPVVVI